MSVKASGGGGSIQPQFYSTTSLSTIMQAEQQDRFLDFGELNQLITFLNSGKKRLEIANILTQNANTLVARAADKIFTGGSAISYLERPQASILTSDQQKSLSNPNQPLDSPLEGLSTLFGGSDTIPTGFKPIDVTKYGKSRMKKSLRDLDWFLRYLTYAIVTGNTNILSVNIRGLRELIDNACSSSVTIVALAVMRRTALKIFKNELDSQAIVSEYFDVLIKEFEASAYTDKLKKQSTTYLQGLKLPQIYSQSGNSSPKFVMKSSLSESEKSTVINACYRQIFERDISKAYSISFSDLESRVKNGKLSIKEFIRKLGLSTIYRQQFFEPFVNSRALELAFRHFLGRGPASLQEFQRFFAIVSEQGLPGLVNALINSQEYASYFGEETVPYIRKLGEEPQECSNWGPQLRLLNYSAPSVKTPEFITLFSDYNQPLPDQHPYGKSNDPLNLQFGAIFLAGKRNSSNYSAPFNKDTRRILVRQGAGIYNQLSNPTSRGKEISTLGPKVFRSIVNSASQPQEMQKSTDSILNAIYLRVFGRLIYMEERLQFQALESQFKESQISVRELIRELAKSKTFRALYWEPFYICKSIEYIHLRLLGRPTYGRQEINKYFDIAYKQGYYKTIDAMINSLEYEEAFGNNKVPYSRYIAPSNVITSNIKINKPDNKKIKDEKFIQLGAVSSSLSPQGIINRVTQGVSARRYQSEIFVVTSSSSLLELKKIFRACVRQVFERDMNTFAIGSELSNARASFIHKHLPVKALIYQIGVSELYQKEFYQSYPNTKVIELGTKHFLGRAPNNQFEIRYYNQILASKGIKEFIESLVYSKEYDIVFGNNTVPYRRFPTLPAANFTKTEKLYNTFIN